MKNLIPFLLAMGVIGCAPQPSISPEEKVLDDTLNRIEIAAGYERHCTEKGKKLNANFYGNMQYIVARLSKEILTRIPANASDEEKMSFVKSNLDPHTQSLRTDIDNTFKKDGCTSSIAEDAKKLYILFTKLHPAELHSMVQRQIVKVKAAK